MKRGEIWYAQVSESDKVRPVLILTRDPVANLIQSIVVVSITRTVRGITSELELTVEQDNLPTDCVANFDNIHTLPKHKFRKYITTLSELKMMQVCQTLKNSMGC